MKPYTYLIGWSKHNKFYYGVRYAKNCSPNDLWKTYFTSSKRVHNLRERIGEPDILQIRKKFTSKEKARLWEYKAIRRFGMISDKRFLNCHDGGAYFMNKGGYSLPERSKEHCKKISESKTGSKWSVSQKEERSKKYSGKGNPRFNKTLTKEQKINLLKGQGKYRKFIINGTQYDLVCEAESDLNIKSGTIKYRLNSDQYKWKDWRYLDDQRVYKYKEHPNKGRKRPDLAARNKTEESRKRSRKTMLRYHHGDQ